MDVQHHTSLQRPEGREQWVGKAVMVNPQHSTRGCSGHARAWTSSWSLLCISRPALSGSKGEQELLREPKASPSPEPSNDALAACGLNSDSDVDAASDRRRGRSADGSATCAACCATRSPASAAPSAPAGSSSFALRCAIDGAVHGRDNGGPGSGVSLGVAASKAFRRASISRTCIVDWTPPPPRAESDNMFLDRKPLGLSPDNMFPVRKTLHRKEGLRSGCHSKAFMRSVPPAGHLQFGTSSLIGERGG
jgi:hypothetical protein